MDSDSQFILSSQEGGPFVLPVENEAIHLSNPTLIIPVRLKDLKRIWKNKRLMV